MPEEHEIFKGYVNECNYSGFTGINNYSRTNEQREFFYRWHLSAVLKKFNKSRGAKAIFITLTLPELKVIQAMFRRVDCDTRTQEIQKKFYAF